MDHKSKNIFIYFLNDKYVDFIITSSNIQAPQLLEFIVQKKIEGILGPFSPRGLNLDFGMVGCEISGDV